MDSISKIPSFPSARHRAPHRSLAAPPARRQSSAAACCSARPVPRRPLPRRRLCDHRWRQRRPRRRRRRRLRRRHRGALPAAVGRQGRVTLVERNAQLHFVPDVQPGARRLADDGRHHRAVRRAAARHGVQGRPRRRDRDRPGRQERASWPTARGCPTTGWCCRRASTSCSTSFAGLSGAGARAACCTPGRPARRPWRCAAQLEAMRDGGVYALTVPQGAVPLPAGAVRARLPGGAATSSRPSRSRKVLVLDANDEVTVQEGAVREAWNEHYPGIVDYRPNHTLTDVDAARARLKFEFDDVQGRRAQRRAAACAPAISRACRAGARQRPLVRGRLADVRVAAGQASTCSATRSWSAPAMPKSRPHGQPARQGRRRGDHRSCCTARAAIRPRW